MGNKSLQQSVSVRGSDEGHWSTVSGSQISGHSRVISGAYKTAELCGSIAKIFYRFGVGHDMLGATGVSDHALEKWRSRMRWEAAQWAAREWASSDADEHRAHLGLAAFDMLLKPIEPWLPRLLKPVNNICLKWDSVAKPRAQCLPLSRVIHGVELVGWWNWHPWIKRNSSCLTNGKEMQKRIMAVWGGLTNSCEKKRSEKQRRKGKI